MDSGRRISHNLFDAVLELKMLVESKVIIGVNVDHYHVFMCFVIWELVRVPIKSNRYHPNQWGLGGVI